jgi:hypothetical protein
MIDLIEKLREEHYRKKGLPKYQDAGITPKSPFISTTPGIDKIFKGEYESPKEDKKETEQPGNGNNAPLFLKQEERDLFYLNKDNYKGPAEEEKKPEEENKMGVSDVLKFWTPNDLQTNLFSIGRMSKYEPKDTSGKVAKGVAMTAYGLSSLGNIARNIAMGAGTQNQYNLAEKYNNDILAERKYKNAQGTANKNNFGGMSFQDGGEQVSEEPMQEEQGMEQQEQQLQEGQQQEQEPQEEGQGQIPQKVLDIANQLVESFDTIEEIDMYLKQNKVDENTYNMIMEAASDIIDANSEEEDQPEDEEVEEEEDIKEGDYVEFEHGGKMHKGRVSKIVNGKIYL